MDPGSDLEALPRAGAELSSTGVRRPKDRPPLIDPHLLGRQDRPLRRRRRRMMMWLTASVLAVLATVAWTWFLTSSAH